MAGFWDLGTSILDAIGQAAGHYADSYDAYARADSIERSIEQSRYTPGYPSLDYPYSQQPVNLKARQWLARERALGNIPEGM